MKQIVLISFYIFLYIIFNLSQVNSQVFLKDNLLYINAKSLSLGEILDEIHQKTGVIFLADDRVNSDKISMQLEKQSLEIVLQRLLKPYGKVILYDQSGEIDQVEIFLKNTNPLHTNGKIGAKLNEQITAPNNEMNFILPSEFDTKMDLIESKGTGPTLDTSNSTKGGGMKITRPDEGGMEMTLPERQMEGM